MFRGRRETFRSVITLRAVSLSPALELGVLSDAHGKKFVRMNLMNTPKLAHACRAMKRMETARPTTRAQ